MREFLRRLQYLMHRRRYDQELASDMEFHREMAAREGKAKISGTSCTCAKRRATRGAGRGSIGRCRISDSRGGC